MEKKGLRFLAVSILILSYSTVFYAFLTKRTTTSIEPKDACQNCNIVVIDIDMLRADAMDCNDGWMNTPNLCGLTSQAMYFRNNISHSDHTIPSITSTLTSLYPSSHGIWNIFQTQLNETTATLPKVLKNNGYKTIFIGSDTGMFRDIISQINFGFDEIGSFAFTHESNKEGKVSLDEMVKNVTAGKQPFFLHIFIYDLHSPYITSTNNDVSDDKPEGIPETWEEFKEKRSEYLANNYKEVFKPEIITSNPEVFQGDVLENKDKIFALYQEYLKPESIGLLPAALTGSWEFEYNAYFQFIDPNNRTHLDYLKSKYLDALHSLDTITLEKVFGLLRSEDLVNNTIVVVKSEHGEEFYEHGRFTHQNDLYQELIHTPLIIKIPGQKGQEVIQLSQDIDLFPTLLELTGIKFPEDLQGKSLIPLISNQKSSVNKYQIAQKGKGDIAVFKKDTWKLIMKNHKPYQLFDLFEDPKEKVNLLDQNPQAASELFKEYTNIMNGLKQPRNAETPEFIDEDTRKRMIEQGYF